MMEKDPSGAHPMDHSSRASPGCHPVSDSHKVEALFNHPDFQGVDRNAVPHDHNQLEVSDFKMFTLYKELHVTIIPQFYLILILLKFTFTKIYKI